MLSNFINDIITSPQRVVARAASLPGSRSQHRQAGDRVEDALLALDQKTSVSEKNEGLQVKINPGPDLEDSFRTSALPPTKGGNEDAQEAPPPMPDPLCVVELRLLSSPSSAPGRSYGGISPRSTVDLFA
jgi:hypothetical protein